MFMERPKGLHITFTTPICFISLFKKRSFIRFGSIIFKKALMERSLAA